MLTHWQVIFPLIWSLKAQAVYHELSMSSFSPPSDVTGGSLFGYSIAYQPNSKKLIASAPKYGTGNVYECNIETKRCDKVKVNGTEGSTYSSMWLGATVATGHNFTVACAPRYTESTLLLGTFGRCYAKTSAESIMNEMIKVDLPVIIPYEKNMDSFGWSIDVDRLDTITVGGPAMARGRAISYNNKNASPQLIGVPRTQEPHFAFGYAVASGNFLSGNEREIIYAVSSPYGKIGYGLVFLTNLTKTWVLSRPTSYKPGVGSLFGGALASASLRGPGQRQALLIGAPTYAEKGRVDVGLVYIYQYDTQWKNVVHQKTILGKKDNGQFGAAIISLGDLNGDRRDEIAVAAPYEDFGRGAVYIYSGGHLLSDVAVPRIRSLQRIQPKGYQAFGLSLTALQDYDDNGCNDINLRVSISHKDARLVNSIKDNKFVEYIQQVRKKTSPVCVDVGIIIPKVVGYEPSVQYQITASQLNSPAAEKTFDASHVLLSDLSVLNVSDTVWVADCACKGECKPRFNLSIDATIPVNYTIGSSDTENVSFSAWNSGDVAYKPRARVALRGIRVVRLPSSCTFSNDALDCFPKQPVEKNTLWQSQQIELDMKSLRSNVKIIKVSISIYPNDQPKEKPVTAERTFNLHSDYNGIVLKGSATDKIELTKEELIEAGKHTSHIYTVYNNGITVWVNLRCRIEMEPKDYYEYFTLSVDSQAPFQCEDSTSNDGLNFTSCIISELRSYQKFDIIIPIYVKPGEIDIDDLNDEKNNKIIVMSHLKLEYEDKQQQGSIVSAVRLKEAAVPIWIVVIAALVGLLIIIIIAVILYECGFLRRKNKDKLKRLRRSVHRQSVHRSMRVSHRANSASERRSGERERLIEENETNEGNTNLGMLNGSVPKTTKDITKGETETPKENIGAVPTKTTELLESGKSFEKKDTRLPETEKDKLIKTDSSQTETKIPQAHNDIPKKSGDKPETNIETLKNKPNVQNKSTEIPKKVVEKSKIINNDHIIRGLQKNVVNRSLTSLPVTAKEAKDASSDHMDLGI